jgi:selenocysteine lyase/cysteine desulfurase
MPNFPAIYAIRAALSYLKTIGVPAIDAAARPLVQECLSEVAKLPVELLTPRDEASVAGILAFRHPSAEAIAQRLRAQRIHIMSHAGRLRVAIHGYNTREDVTTFLRELTAALKAVG